MNNQYLASDIAWNKHPQPCWDGWRPAPEGDIWSLQNNADPVYSIKCSGDWRTNTPYTLGTRIKLTQDGATKYFIVAREPYYGFGLTVMYLYGGTDYDLTANPITNLQYSTDKIPVGFPANPSKWTVATTSDTDSFVNSPTANRWYNNSGAFGSIAVPPGLWWLGYEVSLYVQTMANQTNWSVGATLSTVQGTGGTSGGELVQFISCVGGAGPAGLNQSIGTVGRRSIVAATTTTTYYMNLRTTHSSMDYIGQLNTYHGRRIIRAECAYL